MALADINELLVTQTRSAQPDQAKEEACPLTRNLAGVFSESTLSEKSIFISIKDDYVRNEPSDLIALFEYAGNNDGAPKSVADASLPSEKDPNLFGANEQFLKKIAEESAAL